ncbi:SseB family protein [Microlunatus elymi]|uniref:SseB family protein n=1 Tax=Microlunatus elymi TaxID=2596828 RepID=A0A516Q1S5_9ACTN|nr:SseB family protein [Microlunatus elymi]QDP97332.1 SseB family protein [Microlunatus elymi]
MTHQRTLADTPFPGDDGQADPRARARLAAASSGELTDYLRAIVELCTVRLLVPVVATTAVQGETVAGLATDKEAEMAVVLLQAADGTRAMVGFTGMDSLTAWNAEARPVPVTLDVAAASAKQEGAAALLVDVDGPHPLALDGEILDQLAARHRLVEVGGGQFGWAIAEE